MNKPLILSLAAAALLSTNLNAQSMLERFEAMERQMNALKQEIAELKSERVNSSKNIIEDDDSEEEDEVASNDVEDSEDAEESDEDETVIASADENDDEDDEDENDDENEELASDEERIADLEESVAELSRNTSGSHLKFKIDYRFAIENMQYDMADGSKAENDAFMTNRLWIDMGYKATNNLSFKGQLAYNKAFGARSGSLGQNGNAYETFDWIANENAYDDQIRVRQAYFLWQDQEFFGLDIPWTFSVGRRPSTNGHLINFRDDDHASSPLAHGINVEFDGASAKFTLSKEWGTSVKLCAGRGLSNAAPKFSATPYSETQDVGDIDLAGLIFVLYDDKQYSFNTMYYYADGLIDVTNIQDANQGFNTVGGMHSATANLSINGIGNEWSEFLDETTFFISGAFSRTDPDNKASYQTNVYAPDGSILGQRTVESGMLGSNKPVTGYSYWIGTQFPSLITEDGRWGLEFNHGSKDWRSITYAEDTNIGSKIAVRGNAYEAYLTEYLVDDILSIQLRYTYIDYDYTGSNGFFGNESGSSIDIDSLKAAAAAGNPQARQSLGSVVESAQDIRFYIRYRY